jgi:hypothetical protein
MDCLSIAFADYAHLRTFEKDRALTVVMQRNSTDLDCWILRGKEDELSRIAAGIESAYLRLPLAAFNSRIADLRPGEAWSLDALFSRQRRQAVLRMMPRQDTRQARYLDGWHASLKRHKQGAADWEELADRLAQSAQEGVAADFLPKIADFRNAVLQAARRFAKRPSADTLDHLTLLLDSSGQGGLHLPLWEIQEFAWQGVQDLKAEEEDVEIVEWLVRVLGISEALLIAPPEQ